MPIGQIGIMIDDDYSVAFSKLLQAHHSMPLEEWLSENLLLLRTLIGRELSRRTYAEMQKDDEDNEA